MKKYNNRETAPLFYHSIFLYFILPLNLITNTLGVVAGLNTLSTQTDLFAYALIDFIFALILAVLSGISFCGLRKWKPYSWYTIHAINVAVTLYCVIVIGIVFNVGGSIYTELPEPLAKITVAILISIYYWKRKGLFFNPEITEIITETELNTTNTETTNASKEPFKEKHVNEDFIIETYPAKQTMETKKKPVALIACSVALICSLIGNAYLYQTSQNIALGAEAKASYWEDAYEKLYTTSFELAESLKEIHDEYLFYHDYAVIVPSNSNIYHRHGCGSISGNFYIYNIENAKGQGYKACTKCNPGSHHSAPLMDPYYEDLIKKVPQKALYPSEF